MDLRDRNYARLQRWHISTDDGLQLPDKRRGNHNRVFGALGHGGMAAHPFDINVKKRGPRHGHPFADIHFSGLSVWVIVHPVDFITRELVK